MGFVTRQRSACAAIRNLDKLGGDLYALQVLGRGEDIGRS
jgi:hypothetical protein